MTLQTIPTKDGPAIYVISNDILIRSEQDALDLIGETQPESLILHDYNFEPEFFDLSTRTLGEVLQKFTNYRIRVAILGDFSKYPSQILPNFIAESNRRKAYIFVATVSEIKALWE